MSRRDRPQPLEPLGGIDELPEEATEEVGIERMTPTVLPDFDDDPATEAIDHEAPAGLPADHQVVRALGEIAGRECFEVVHTVLGRLLVLEIAPVGTGAEWIAQRACLTQPGVLQVYEMGVLDDGRRWFTRGRVEGVTFSHWANTVTRVAVVGAVIQAARTLGAAHANGIGHGAVSADAIRVLPGNQVVVVGWEAGEAATDTRAVAEVLATALGTRVPPRLAVVLQRARGGYYAEGAAFAAALEDVLQVR